jgi:hypothetical protein
MLCAKSLFVERKILEIFTSSKETLKSINCSLLLRPLFIISVIFSNLTFASISKGFISYSLANSSIILSSSINGNSINLNPLDVNSLMSLTAISLILDLIRSILLILLKEYSL